MEDPSRSQYQRLLSYGRQTEIILRMLVESQLGKRKGDYGYCSKCRDFWIKEENKLNSLKSNLQKQQQEESQLQHLLNCPTCASIGWYKCTTFRSNYVRVTS